MPRERVGEKERGGGGTTWTASSLEKSHRTLASRSEEEVLEGLSLQESRPCHQTRMRTMRHLHLLLLEEATDQELEAPLQQGDCWISVHKMTTARRGRGVNSRPQKCNAWNAVQSRTHGHRNRQPPHLAPSLRPYPQVIMHGEMIPNTAAKYEWKDIKAFFLTYPSLVMHSLTPV